MRELVGEVKCGVECFQGSDEVGDLRSKVWVNPCFFYLG